MIRSFYIRAGHWCSPDLPRLALSLRRASPGVNPPAPPLTYCDGGAILPAGAPSNAGRSSRITMATTFDFFPFFSPSRYIAQPTDRSSSGVCIMRVCLESARFLSIRILGVTLCRNRVKRMRPSGLFFRARPCTTLNASRTLSPGFINFSQLFECATKVNSERVILYLHYRFIIILCADPCWRKRGTSFAFRTGSDSVGE